MDLRKRACGSLAAVIALVALTPACTPASPAPPVTTSRPTASPTETTLEREQRLAFESAEKSYRAFRSEYDRLGEIGYSGPPTPTLKKYAAGPYLKAMSRFLRANKGIRSVGSVEIVTLTRASYSPQEVTLLVCEDGSRVKNYDRKGRLLGRGVAAKITLQFQLSQGRWKVWDGTDVEVESCTD